MSLLRRKSKRLCGDLKRSRLEVLGSREETELHRAKKTGVERGPGKASEGGSF